MGDSIGINLSNAAKTLDHTMFKMCAEIKILSGLKDRLDFQDEDW
jgi:hypothetical protein